MRRLDPNATLIGFAPGAKIGTNGIGAAALAMSAIEAHLGAPQGSTMAADYYYPGLTNSAARARAYNTAAAAPGHAGGRLMNWGGYLTDEQNKPLPAATWAAFAKAMLAEGCADDYLRAGHEGDGNWMPGAAGRIGDAAYGQYLTDAIHAVKTAGWDAGIEVNFDTYAAGVKGLDVEKMLPPRGLFDVIGLDVYDYVWQGLSPTDHPAAWTHGILPRLEATRALADKHGVRWAVSETGQCIAVDGHGGGDSRYFTDQLVAYALKYTPAWLTWFLAGDRNAQGVYTRRQDVFIPAPDGKTYIDNPLFPVAAKAYREQLQPATFVRTAAPPPPATDDAATIAALRQQLDAAQQALEVTQARLDVSRNDATTYKAQLDAAQQQLAADEAQSLADHAAYTAAHDTLENLRTALEAVLAVPSTP